MDLQKAIKDIIDEFGRDIIAEKRFVNMIADYYSFRDNPAEKIVLTTLVNEGYSERFLNMDSGDDAVINQIINDLCRNYGFRQELVSNVISNLFLGLNIDNNKLKIKDDEKKIVCDQQIVSIKYYLKETIPGNYHSNLIVYNAYGYYNEIDGSFLILKGSLLAYQDLDYDEWYLSEDKKRRKTIINLHCHWEKPYFVVDSDIRCETPTLAALVVSGSRLNGAIVWKDSSGKSIYQAKGYKVIRRDILPKRIF